MNFNFQNLLRFQRVNTSGRFRTILEIHLGGSPGFLLEVHALYIPRDIFIHRVPLSLSCASRWDLCHAVHFVSFTMVQMILLPTCDYRAFSHSCMFCFLFTPKGTKKINKQSGTSRSSLSGNPLSNPRITLPSVLSILRKMFQDSGQLFLVWYSSNKMGIQLPAIPSPPPPPRCMAKFHAVVLQFIHLCKVADFRVASMATCPLVILLFLAKSYQQAICFFWRTWTASLVTHFFILS